MKLVPCTDRRNCGQRRNDQITEYVPLPNVVLQPRRFLPESAAGFFTGRHAGELNLVAGRRLASEEPCNEEPSHAAV